MESKFKSSIMHNQILNNGTQIPMLGYGVFELPDAQCTDYVLKAVDCGYRHFDTAQIYKNEAGVGRAIAECGVARNDLFITTKVWPKNYDFDKAMKSIDESLEKLQTDYVDLLLLHRPFFNYKDAWRALERAYADGKAKAIGLSNFNIPQTEDILSVADIVPAVNQIELHPYYSREKLKKYLNEKGVAVEAWYPLGHGSKKILREKLFKELSEKYNKTPAQIILRWHVQSGHIVIPKSRSDKHMKDNLDVFSFNLSIREMERIDELNKNKPFFRTPEWIQKLTARR